MNIFIDENIPKITKEYLISKRYNVADVRNTNQEGIPDSEIWNICQNEKRLLITTDKGFSNYRFDNHFGMIIVLLKKPNKLKINDRIVSEIENHNSMTDWQNKIVIVKDNSKSVFMNR